MLIIVLIQAEIFISVSEKNLKIGLTQNSWEENRSNSEILITCLLWKPPFVVKDAKFWESSFKVNNVNNITK